MVVVGLTLTRQHPFENPNYFTNMVEAISQVRYSYCIDFCIRILYQNEKTCLCNIWRNDIVFFTVCNSNNVYFEMHGNPEIARMGIQQNTGAMEGKEVRFGPAASAYWSIVTTINIHTVL